MPWNDAILQHPDLTPTEKLLYHLLRDLGPDSPQVRARIACMLGLTERHMRRVGVKLAGIGDVDSPEPEQSSLGNPHPVPGNVDNQHIGRAHVDNPRTCTRMNPKTPPTRRRSRTTPNSWLRRRDRWNSTVDRRRPRTRLPGAWGRTPIRWSLYRTMRGMPRPSRSL